MYKHILISVDGSENSLRAAEQAASIIELMEDVIVDVVSVIAIDVYSDMVYDPIAAHGDTQREIIAPAIEAVERSGVEPNVVLLHGQPAEEIITYADENDVDLIIIGSRGLNVIQEFAIGSVSHKVIKNSKCPVLVVK